MKGLQHVRWPRDSGVCHWSNNMHVLTPRAELLKNFDIASPRFIKFKKNSYVCLVVSDNRTKVYVFQDL